MKTIKALAAVAAVTTITGCAGVYSPVGNGLIFTNVQGPVAISDADKSSKSGTACATNILGIVASGDASIESAKANGNITQVASVDHSSSTVLGLFGKFCTTVSGQ